MSYTPKHVMMRLANELINLVKGLNGKVRKLLALGDAEFVEREMETLCALRRAVDIVKTLPCAAYESRMNDAIREARGMLKRFEKRERAHLSSLATAILMRERLSMLTPAKAVEAKRAFSAWDELRQGHPTLLGLRQAYDAMEKALQEAEFDLPVEKRVKMTLAPPPVKQALDSKRGKRLRDQEIRKAMKGKQLSDDSRGHGRSKKAAAAR